LARIIRVKRAATTSLTQGVGDRGKLATLDNALSRFAAFTPSRAHALGIIQRVWGEVRQWKTTFEAHGANSKLIEQIAGALQELEHIAGAGLVNEVRSGQ
jgi:serine/threonine-protein kinase HipA